jgi:hypothetical protein
MRVAPKVLLSLLLLLASGYPAHLLAQDPSPGTIQGTVVDSGSGQPLEGAVASIADLGLSVETDSSGRFSLFGVPPGQHTLSVELFGYYGQEELVTVNDGSTVSLTLALAVAPFQAAPLEVSVEGRDYDLELSGFYDREESTSGVFITPEDIEDRRPTFTTDLFRGIPGTKVAGGLGFGTQAAVVLQGSRSLSLLEHNPQNECYPAIWIDGQMVHSGSVGFMEDEPAFVDDLIRPDQIAGVEVYSGAARVPVQFNLYSACGVIVFWTKRGQTRGGEGVPAPSRVRPSAPMGAPRPLGPPLEVLPLDPGDRIRVRTSPTQRYTGTFMRVRDGSIVMRTSRETRVPLPFVTGIEVEENKSPLITLVGAVIGAGVGIALGMGTDMGISGAHEAQGKMLEPAFGALLGGVSGGLISYHFFGKEWKPITLNRGAPPGGG